MPPARAGQDHPILPILQLSLAPTVTAPARARAAVTAWLGKQSRDDVLVELAVLLVSELVTNSVLHGGPPVVVAVDCDEATLQVRVRDGSPMLPAPRDAASGDENGRGLALVAEMSADWGVDTEEDGKHVWFVIH